jgi:SAM-dependent methyltransferase
VEEETGPDPWEESVAAFVEAHLLMPPSRVLDVGCGNGWLTRRLSGAGYEAKGTDPDAPEGPLFDRLALEEFVDPRPFDAIVGVLSLHHIPGLGAAVRKIADLLRAQGTLAVVEFAWDRFDDATARWCLDRLPPELDPDNWLHRRCAELRNSLQEGKALETAEHFRRWAAEERFHSSRAILEELGKRFREQSFAWSPYLFPDLEGVTEADELGAIESGVIQPIGFRFVGQRRR